jgi:hypothetical protein
VALFKKNQGKVFSLQKWICDHATQVSIKGKNMTKVKAVEPATKAVAIPEHSTAVVAGSMMDIMEQMAGHGLEEVKAKDLLVPRLAILQKLSPQIDRKKADRFIPDAKVGDICDVGLNEIMESPLIFIPVHFMTQYLEWRPQRKGLAAIHNDPAILQKCTRNERNQYVLPNGNTISETSQFFGLNVNADYRFSFIPMTSTQLKKARTWNTLAMSEKLKRKDGSEFTPPFFYRSYALSSVNESNEQGDWEGWKIERHLPVTEIDGAPQRIIELATSFYNSIKEGRAKADVSSLDEEDGSADKDRM